MDSVFEKAMDLGYKESLPQIDANEFLKVVKSRRSVRVFKPERIPKEIIEQVLDVGLLAPSSSNLQTWQFYWIQDPEVKKAMDEACLSQPAAKTAPEMIAVVARTDNWRKNSRQMLKFLDQQTQSGVTVPKALLDYYGKLVPFVYSQGWFSVLGWFRRVLYFFVGFFRAVPRYPVTQAQLREWSVKSAALAAENIMLAFRAFGYDSCPMEGFDEARVKKALGIGRGAHVVMVIGAGKREESGVYGPRVRFPRDQFVFIK